MPYLSSLRDFAKQNRGNPKYKNVIAEVALGDFAGFQARNCEIRLIVYRAVECAESRKSVKDTTR